VHLVCSSGCSHSNLPQDLPEPCTLLPLQVGIGICTKTTAEATKRGDMFFSELDFVVANVIMALVADFCLVWLPAPTVTWRCSTDFANPHIAENVPSRVLSQFPAECGTAVVDMQLIVMP